MRKLVQFGLCLCLASSLSAKTEEIPIGTILSLWDDYKEVFSAMQFALQQQHNQTNQLFHFKLYADNIKTVDAYKLTRIICRQVSNSSFVRLFVRSIDWFRIRSLFYIDLEETSFASSC